MRMFLIGFDFFVSETMFSVNPINSVHNLPASHVQGLHCLSLILIKWLQLSCQGPALIKRNL